MEKKKCPNCGACQECGSVPQKFVPWPYPVKVFPGNPYPYPPVTPSPYRPQPYWYTSGGSYRMTNNTADGKMVA